jgi:type IV pilus assembly protein PilC
MSNKPMLNTFHRYFHHAKQRKKITPFDIILFLRQFATLIAAGIPLIQACDILEQSQEKRALRLLIYAIKRDILSGKNLYASLRQHPRYFDELTCHLIQIGEHTGKLDSLLITIATYQEKNLALHNKIKQALFYPCLLAITAIVMTLAMLIFVIPHFATLFQDIANQLPPLTRGVFYLSYLLQHYGWLLLMMMLVPVLMLSLSPPTFNKKRALRHAFAKLPLINTCLYKMTLARFARQVAITLNAGLPLTEALRLSANACDNAAFKCSIAKIHSRLSSGLQLHQAMETTPPLPTLMVQMVKTGEEAGMLEQMLDKMAEFFESDSSQLSEKLGQLLEPLIMMILGVLIGGLVISLYLPIFNVGSAL